MYPVNTELAYLNRTVVLPAGAVAVAYDEDCKIYAFYDVPVIMEDYWATTMAGFEFAPVFLGSIDKNCLVNWQNSLVIYDEEVRQNVEEEAFQNAKQVN